jgi:hypothetical protein
VVFLGVLALLARTGTRAGCGCFGESDTDGSVWWGVVRNIGLLAAAMLVGLQHPLSSAELGTYAGAGTVAMGTILSYLVLRTTVVERARLFASVR